MKAIPAKNPVREVYTNGLRKLVIFESGHLAAGVGDVMLGTPYNDVHLDDMVVINPLNQRSVDELLEWFTRKTPDQASVDSVSWQAS